MERNKRVFIDSNFFVALFNPNDALRTVALSLADQIEQEKIRLVISNFIFLEVVTILSQRVGKKTATQAGEYLMTDPWIELIHIDEDIQQQTWQTFQKVKQKDISFVDCSTVIIATRERMYAVLTFDDKDFRRLQTTYAFRIYNIPTIEL